jgi:hypothetical protein
MRETYEKRMKINEIIFIRTKVLWNASVWVPYIWRTSSVFSVCLEYAYRSLSYKPYVRIRTKFLSMLKKSFCLAVCHRTRPCLKRIQPMPIYTPIAFVSVFQRMSDIFHTLTCASTIRNSVTGPLLQICKQVVTRLLSNCDQNMFAQLVPSCCYDNSENKLVSPCYKVDDW